MIDILKNILQPEEDFILGFADLRGLLNSEFEQYPFGICIGKCLDNTIVDAIENGPTMEYYNHYQELNYELNNLAGNICNELKKKNINCSKIVPTVGTLSEEFKPYLHTLRYKFSHKMVATRAGLGWIGKTDLFISHQFGPRVRLVSILIDRSVTVQKEPIEKSKCGKCNICVDRCPAKASNGKLWDIFTDRDVFFDPHKCREKCGELAKLFLNRDTRVCGICVSVCPIGKKNKLSSCV